MIIGGGLPPGLLGSHCEGCVRRPLRAIAVFQCHQYLNLSILTETLRCLDGRGDHLASPNWGEPPRAHAPELRGNHMIGDGRW